MTPHARPGIYGLCGMEGIIWVPDGFGVGVCPKRHVTNPQAHGLPNRQILNAQHKDGLVRRHR